MKINFIVNQEDQNSELDANILSFLFKKIKYTTDIKLVNVNNFKCDNAALICPLYDISLPLLRLP